MGDSIIPDLTLFVACYNEEKNIVDTLDVATATCREANVSVEIIVIDDTSTDDSVNIIKQYIEEHKAENIRLIVNEENQGLGANFGEAAFQGLGKYYKLMCGDNVEPRENLLQMLQLIGKADLVLAYYPKGVIGRSAFRNNLSKLYVKLVNLISGHNLRYYNGLPVFHRSSVVRWNPNAHGFGFQADLITRLLDKKATYLEIPLEAHERLTGKSKAITFKNFCSVGHSLLNIFIRRISKIVYGKKK